MTEIDDRAALKLAIETYSAWDIGCAEQIKALMRRDGWPRAAVFAASCCQSDVLDLKPWQIPPCHILNADNPDDGLGPDQPGPASDGRHQAAQLLRRMLALGVSKYHPDPLAAIEAAEKRAR